MTHSQVQAENATEQLIVSGSSEDAQGKFRVALMRAGCPHIRIAVSKSEDVLEATIPTPMDRDRLARSLEGQGLIDVTHRYLKPEEGE